VLKPVFWRAELDHGKIRQRLCFGFESDRGRATDVSYFQSRVRLRRARLASPGRDPRGGRIPADLRTRGLNALVILVNGSSRIVLAESPSQNPFENIEPGSEYSEFFPEPRKSALVDLERIVSAVFIAVAICGVAGAVGLFNRRTWSRGLQWGTTGAEIAGHALYTLRVLQIQSADVIDVIQRQQAFELVATASLINVAIQSIPLVILAGLLRHSALRSYVFGSPGPGDYSPIR
jgi:hypothetical protein